MALSGSKYTATKEPSTPSALTLEEMGKAIEGFQREPSLVAVWVVDDPSSFIKVRDASEVVYKGVDSSYISKLSRIPIYNIMAGDIEGGLVRARPFLHWPGVWCEMSNNEVIKIEV